MEKNMSLPDPFEFEMPTRYEPNGNAFVILGMFKSHAESYGWSESEIEEVMNDAMSGDYEHLRQTIGKYTTDPDTGDLWYYMEIEEQEEM